VPRTTSASGLSASHVSAVLARAHSRADPVSLAEISGFVVTAPVRADDGTWVVPVGYQDYDHEGDYSDAAGEAISREADAAFDAYAVTLRDAGYVVENWIKYDGSRLGLFVTGRNR
jgi:hypothetical protein